MMNSDDVIGIYEAVSDLTGQMLAAAQSNDWDHLVELESHCSSRVQTLKDGEPAALLSGAVRSRKIELIHKILAHDREIRNLATPWMAQLATMINSTGAQRKLSHAYGDNQSA